MPQKKANELEPGPASLRARAEELLRARPADLPTLPPADVQALVHELNVHQMELEIQNEELRRAQLELADSLDRHSDLYDFAPVGYLTLDEAGCILEANLTACNLLGLERKRLLGSNLSARLAPDSQDAFHLHRQAVLSGNSRQICDLNLRKADGTPWGARLESIAYGAKPGRECHTALIDVTAVQAARRRVEESEGRFRRLTEAVTDYVYRVRVVDARAVETIHGANCEAVTGYTPDEFRENPLLWIAMVPSEDRPIVERQVAGILSGQDAPPIEHRIRRKDGQTRWVLNTVSPHRAERGRLAGYDGLLRDITKRKEAEEALRQLNETLEQRVAEKTHEVRLLAEAMANLGEGVMITSDDLQWPGAEIVYVNAAMCRITGYTAGELIGRTPRILQGEKTEREILDRIRGELTDRHPHLCELVSYRKDGTTYDAELFISPLFDAQGRHTNFIVIHRDITGRKRLEQEVLRISEEEKRSFGRELHDGICQQLHGISFMADSLAKDLSGTDPANAKLAAEISGLLAKAAEDARRISHGLTPIMGRSGGFFETLRELVKSVEQMYGLQCELVVDESFAIEGDELATHLYRIAQEAINNAVRHGRARHISVELTREASTISLCVRDDGRGFADEPATREGVGLRVMRYRAVTLGGQLNVRSLSPGVEVVCSIPWTEDAPARGSQEGACFQTLQATRVRG